MREKGGLHMEKMEHMDPQRCDRIWQRVSPELDPYPEVRAACREPSREPGAENIPERTGAAAVPAAPEIPAEPAESGCCLAGRAADRARFRHRARRAGGGFPPHGCRVGQGAPVRYYVIMI